MLILTFLSSPLFFFDYGRRVPVPGLAVIIDRYEDDPYRLSHAAGSVGTTGVPETDSRSAAIIGATASRHDR